MYFVAFHLLFFGGFHFGCTLFWLGLVMFLWGTSFCALSSFMAGNIIYSRLQKSCNKQAEQWKSTIDLLCLNRVEGYAGVGKIIRFVHGKSVMIFHCSTCVLQDFCNLLYPAGNVILCFV